MNLETYVRLTAGDAGDAGSCRTERRATTARDGHSIECQDCQIARIAGARTTPETPATPASSARLGTGAAGLAALWLDARTVHQRDWERTTLERPRGGVGFPSFWCVSVIRGKGVDKGRSRRAGRAMSAEYQLDDKLQEGQLQAARDGLRARRNAEREERRCVTI